MFYQNYVALHGGPPKSVDQFKEYVRGAYPSKAEFLGEFNPEKAFVSARDNQPLEWVFAQAGSRATRTDSSGPRIVVYEKTGVDGKHLVAMSNMMVVELDDAELKQELSSPAGG